MTFVRLLPVIPIVFTLSLAACGGGSGGSAAGAAPSGATTQASLTAGTASLTPTVTPLVAPGTPPSVSPTRPPAQGTVAPALRVLGSAFVDGNGQPVQLRGVNLSGLEFVAIQGWSPANPWGGQTGTATPDWAAIKSWGSNVVRLPLNEASWLGGTCVDTGGVRGAVGGLYAADPGSNYQATVRAAVANASAAGLDVIVDLHWTAPGNACPMAQNPLPDADRSLTFWTQVAQAFRSYPNVAFEAFNEPFLYYLSAGASDWGTLLHGGTLTGFVTGGTPYTVTGDWTAAGMQSIVDTIRATGATNVILVGAVSYTQDLSQWLAWRPSDPLGQLAATWHAYPTFGAAPGSAAYTQPNFSPGVFTAVAAIQAAGVPVLITEFGDHNAAGTTGAPFAAALLPRADRMGLGYLGWSWDVFGTADNVLITDGSGTPSPGYGVYVKAHYLCRAAGTVSCT